MNAKIKLSPPWLTFYHEMEALFGEDPEIRIEYSDSTETIKLYVDNTEKAEALSKLLPVKKSFGNVTVTIQVIPANESAVRIVDLFDRAFKGNPALSYVRTTGGAFGIPMDYVVFKNRVVQFFNDDISDINGLKSTLYQEIAKDIFDETTGIFFCTDVEEGTARDPLGE